MSYTEVEQLRKSGNLTDAYEMAMEDLKTAETTNNAESQTETIINGEGQEELIRENPLVLGRRAMAWVLHDFMKESTDKEYFEEFIDYLREFVELGLDAEEKMVVNQLLWVIGKAAFEFTKEPEFDIAPMEDLADVTMQLNFTKQSKAYSFLFKAFHKALKESPKYIEFASWWDMRSFIRDDFKYTKQSDGKRIMAVVEQGCNRYAKHLIAALNNNPDSETAYDLKLKIKTLLPFVESAIEYNKHFRKLPYYHIKMLLAIGETKKSLKLLLSKAKENNDEFWIWELLAKAYDDNPEKKTACLATALLCRSKPERRIIVRMDLAKLLIEQEYYDQAKTEVAMILQCCLENKWDIPDEVTEWGEQAWYNKAAVIKDNIKLYEEFRMIIDDIIYGDITPKKVVVENVNTEKKILNFIGLEHDQGYCKYDKSLDRVKQGDILLVRLKDAGMQGRYTLISAKKLHEKYLEGILKHFAGEIIKPNNKAFGFVDGMYITPDVCTKYNLQDGEYVTGKAMIAYNKKKEEWGWKVISIDS
jgi:hypothetical protein